MPSAQRVDDALSLRELLAIIQDLYRQLQALEPDTGKPRYKVSPEYLKLEAEIQAYAQQVWALTDR